MSLTLEKLIEDARAAVAEGDLEKANELKARAEALKAIDDLTPAQPEPDPRLEALEKENAALKAKAKKATGVLVEKDETDKQIESKQAWKGFGDFLLTVARAANGQMDKRLLAIKSDSPMDEGGFDVAAAMGPAFVGRMGKSTKAEGMNETVPSAGGFLVDTDRQMGILSKVYNTGQLLQRVDMVPISANSNGMTFYAEDETSRADGSRKGGIRAYWRAEAAAATDTQPKFREMELKLQSLMALVYATDELLADARALEAWVNNNLPDELRFVAEDSIVNGSGAGQPLGALNSGALISVAKETGQTAATVVAENIWKMYARMWAPSVARATWLISQDVWPQLFQLSLKVGTGGSAIFQPPGGISAAPFGTLMGRPILPVEYCPAVGTVGDIMFVDLGEYQMINKGGIEQAMSMHVRFIYGENTFRFTYRIDGQPKWDAPITPKNSGDTQSPFVALATRS